MKRNRILGAVCFSMVLVLGSASPAAHADEGMVSLEDQLQGLALPGNQAPVQMSTERLYAVQTRYAPLKFVHELSIGGGRNFTGDSFMVSQELNLNYRFHLNDRWSLGLGGAYVFNELSSGGKRLLASEGLLPDVAYAKIKADLSLGYNVFYGKFRLSMDQVFYFDQYVSLGAGIVKLSTSQQTGAVADAGMVFWLGRGGSVRVGIKDYVYNEKRAQSSGVAQNLIGHLDVGFLFGGSKQI